MTLLSQIYIFILKRNILFLIDVIIRDLTLKAGDVPQMKLGERYVGDLGRDASNVHRRDEFQVFLRTLVDNASSRAVVDPHREILLDREKLGHVGFTIGDHFVTVHRRGWIIANVVRDPYTAVEQLDGNVIAVLAVVEEDPVLLRGREHDRHVRFRPRA